MLGGDPDANQDITHPEPEAVLNYFILQEKENVICTDFIAFALCDVRFSWR